VRFKIRPLSAHETNQYIAHRLLVAGASGEEIFSPAALTAIYRYSQGVPRLINLACDRALLQGFVDQDPHLTPASVALALKSLDQEVGMGPTGVSERRRRPPHARLVAAAALVLVLGFAGGWLAAREWLGAPAPSVTPPAEQTAARGAGREGVFAVFVSSHASEGEARRVERQLAERGYASFTAVNAAEDSGRSYWVFAGRFHDIDEANQTRDRLANQDGYPQPRTMRLAEGVRKQP